METHADCADQTADQAVRMDSFFVAGANLTRYTLIVTIFTHFLCIFLSVLM